MSLLAPIYSNTLLLLKRLTKNRTDNLDNLNATITSRAPESTALSTNDWTPTKSTYIDVPISSRANGSYWTSGLATTISTNLDDKISLKANAATALSTADWTQARANNLSLLDVAISSRANGAQWSTALATTISTNLDAKVSLKANAATALSTAVWTQDKANNLNIPISYVASSNPAFSYRIYTSTTTFTVPTNVYNIYVLAVGAGGKGGGGTTAGGGGGGGGGGLAYSTINTLPGTQYDVTVGVQSTSTSTNTSTGIALTSTPSTWIVRAYSGKAGFSGATRVGGVGGGAIGGIAFSGGDGANGGVGGSSGGGAGGSSACMTGDGVTATNSIYVKIAATDIGRYTFPYDPLSGYIGDTYGNSGSGGSGGQFPQTGSNGATFSGGGGGGGGVGVSGTTTGGNGGSGIVIIFW